MKKILGYLFLGTILSTCASSVKAQVEPHFSQYYMYPLWLNPALTGAVDGNYRVSAIHRNQWSSITNAFSTIGVSADVVTDKHLNIGVNLLQQSAGDIGYKYGNGQLSLCYTGVRLGKEGNKVIAFALQGGFLSRRFDASKIITDNQFNTSSGTYDPTRSTNELGQKTSVSSLDMGAGLLFYDANPENTVNLFGGFAASHLTQPKDPSLSANSDSKLPVRYTVHGGANIYLSEKAHIVPNALYMMQGNATEAMIGGYVQMAANTSTDIMAGANYRFKDAIYPYVGLSYNNFTFGLSYDVNTSQLGKLVGGASSFEISLMYSGTSKEKGFFKCPRF